MPTQDFSTLRNLIVDLESYVSKELSLNTEPRSLKGDNATDTTLPADWEKKNDAIVGEKESGAERADAGNDSKSTKTGSQSDPYIHKQDIERMVEQKVRSLMQKQGGGGFMMGEDEMENDGWDDIDDESAGDMNAVPPADGMSEMADDDMEQKMNHYKDGEEMMGGGMPGMEGGGMDEGMGGDENAVQVLNEIKALLANGLMAKQLQYENSQLRDEVNGLKGSMKSTVEKQVNTALKQFNLQPSSADVNTPTRRNGNIQKSAPVAKQMVTQQVSAQPGDGIPMHNDKDIAPMQNGSMGMRSQMGQFYGDDSEAIHKAIVDQTGELVKSDGQKPSSTDFKEFFDKLNKAHEAQSGTKVILYDRM